MNAWGSRGKVASLVVLAVLASAVFIFPASKETAKHTSSAVQEKSDPAILHASSKTNTEWNSAYANLPLRFEENQGQTAEQVRFVSRGAGYQLFLTSQEAVLALRRSGPHDLSPRHRAKTLRALRQARLAERTTALRMQFAGANPSARMVGEDQLPGKVNYFTGSDPRNWHAGIPTFSRVKYASIYPGVDLIYYGNQRRLEYDLVVAPGADPNAIALNLEGARGLRINKSGDLVVKVDGGEVELQKPVVYQNIDGQKKQVAARYAISGTHRVTFAVAGYDRKQTLILDPVLNYSTYLGGSGDDQAWAVAVDSNNNAVVAGNTFSTDFPVTAGTVTVAPETSNTNGAVFVTQINSGGTGELYSTYLSGGSDLGDYAFGVAVDSSNKIYVTGQTHSTDFPTTANAFKQTLPSNASGTSFITKIDPTQSGNASLLYSSYVGGTNGDYGDAVAADAAGNAYISGVSFSSPTSAPFSTATNFPIFNGFQTTLNTPDGNAYLVRIDTTQSGTASLVYSTYLGGSGDFALSTGTGEEAFGVAVDSSSNAYLTGTTSSLDFPASTANGGPNNGYQVVAPPSIVNGTVFVAKINTAATGAASLTYASYLGGDSTSVGDFGAAIAVGPGNVAYVAGSTSSIAFPTTTGAFQTTGDTHGLAFISLIDTEAVASLKYSTVIGGSFGTIGSGIRADSAGNAYLTGGTASPPPDFPLSVGAFQTAFAPGGIGAAYIVKLNPAGGGAADLLYSTYFGGAGIPNFSDQAMAIAIDSATPPNAYIAGQTYSSAATFPVSAGAFQTALGGTSDAFVAKLSLVPIFSIAPSSLDFGIQLLGSTSAAQTLTVTNNGSSAVTFTSIAIAAGTPAASATDYVKSADTCLTTVAAGATCTVSVTFAPSIAGAESAALVFTDSDSTSPQSIPLTGTGAAFTVSPTTLTFGNQTINTASAAQVVTLSNSTATAVTFTSAVSSNPVFATTTTCVASVPAAAGAVPGTCVVSVIFTPTATGAATGTLTITDGDASSPQLITLTGNGTAAAADFMVGTPATASVAQGGTTTFTVTITPQNGFNQTVALACTGAPANSTCTVAPASVTTTDGTTAQTATVTVTTTAPHAAMLMAPPAALRIPPTTYVLRGVPFLLAFVMFLLFRSTQNTRVRLITLAAMFIFIVVGGCSSSDNNGGTTGGTPKGTSNLTITGTSGALSHTAPVALTVN